MANTDTLASATGNLAFLNAVDSVNQPGISPNPYGNLSPTALSLSTRPVPTNTQTSGIAALQQKTKESYSNRQFIAPLNYQINVEGTWITVDILGKRVITDNNAEYRSIASLSAINVIPRKIENARFDGIERLVKDIPQGVGLLTGATGAGTPALLAAGQQFISGKNATIDVLSNRFSQFTSLITDKSTLNLNSLTPSLNIGSTLNGVISDALPTTQITQSLAKVPGLNIVTNSLGNLPGASNLFSMLNNPVGAVEGVVGKAASSLNLQAGLPSIALKDGEFSLGSLPDVFSAATDIFHNGPPTSLTGLISLEKQVKGLVCNFTPPVIKLPSFDSITSFKFPKLEDIEKQIKKEFDDLKSNIINQLDIVKQLKDLLPDPEELFKDIVKELTTCDEGPTSANADKSGSNVKASG